MDEQIADRDGEDGAYEPPALVPLGRVDELTRSPATSQEI